MSHRFPDTSLRDCEAVVILHSAKACAAERNRKDGVDGPNGIDVPKCGLSEPATREPPAMSISMIGLDTAKSVFQIHGVNETGKVEIKRKLRRSELIAFFEKQESCTVVMEACGAAHHWARMLTGLGHTVKRSNLS
jgi:hypothetical protein